MARLRRCYWALFWAYLAEIPMRAFTLVAMPLYFPAYLLPGLAYTIILARLAQWDWRYERAWGMSYVCCAMRCLVEMCAYTHLPMSRVSAALLFTLSAFVISAPAPLRHLGGGFCPRKGAGPLGPGQRPPLARHDPLDEPGLSLYRRRGLSHRLHRPHCADALLYRRVALLADQKADLPVSLRPLPG